MKIDILFLEKYLVSKFVKISGVINLLTNHILKSTQTKNSALYISFINQLSKTDKYQNIIEKVQQFKSDEVKKKKPKKRTKEATLIDKFMSSEKYQNIIKKVKQFKSNKIKKSKSKKRKKEVTLINKFLSSKKYQNIIEKVRQFKNDELRKKKVQKFNSLQLSLFDLIQKIKSFEQLKKFKLFDYNSLIKTKDNNKKFDQKIGIVFYGDHNLILLSLLINLNNKVQITGVTEMPIPGNVIGDSLVEDSNELANIALDSINLLELNTSPLLVVLSSTFFNIHSFKASDLKQISQSDSKVQSKSPYLPANTLVEFLRMADSKISNSYVRTIYSKKDFIKGWTDSLEMIDLPIIGLIPAAPQIFDSITNKIVEENTILIDIESSSTSVLIGSKLSKLNSHKLPFGSSLYISNNLKESSNNYFDRVLKSIKLIMNQNNEKLPLNIFVMGTGLDQLITPDFTLPNGFRSIAELKLTDYSYSPKKMQIHELVSNSIDASIYSLTSILTSCI